MHISAKLTSIAIVVFLMFWMIISPGKATAQPLEQSEQQCQSSGPYHNFSYNVFDDMKDLQISLSVLSFAEKDEDIGRKIGPFIEVIADSSVFALANIMSLSAVYIRSCTMEESTRNYEKITANRRFIQLLSGVVSSKEFFHAWANWYNLHEGSLCGHISVCINPGAVLIEGRMAKQLKAWKENRRNLQENHVIIAASILLGEKLEGRRMRNLGEETSKPAPQFTLSPYGQRLANTSYPEFYSWSKNLSTPEKLAALSAYYLPQK